MRTMYDAVNPANLPPGANLYAGYTDGKYANIDAIKARFPGKPVVTISVNGTTAADVLDVEAGNIAPEHAPAWVRWMRRNGSDPTVYCPLSLWPACKSSFMAQATNPPHWWVAHYDGDPTIPPGAVAKQYRSDVQGGYDVSSVIDGWPTLPLSKVTKPMFDPPILIVSSVAAPSGKGGWNLLADGGVFTFGDAQFYGAPIGQPYWQGRKPATIQLSTSPGKVYDVVATSGEVYDYPE